MTAAFAQPAQLAGLHVEAQTEIEVRRYPDRSAVAYCGPFSLVLALNDPEAIGTMAGYPWTVSLYDADGDVVISFAERLASAADAIFTQLSAYLASYDGSRAWEEHLGDFFVAA